MWKDPITKEMMFFHPRVGKTKKRPEPGTPIEMIRGPNTDLKMNNTSFKVNNVPKYGPNQTLTPKNFRQAKANLDHTKSIQMMGIMPSNEKNDSNENSNENSNKNSNETNTQPYEINYNRRPQRLANKRNYQSKQDAAYSMNKMTIINEQMEKRRTPQQRANLVKASYNRVAQSKRQNGGKKKIHSTRKRRHSSFRLKNNK